MLAHLKRNAMKGRNNLTLTWRYIRCDHCWQLQAASTFTGRRIQPMTRSKWKIIFCRITRKNHEEGSRWKIKIKELEQREIQRTRIGHPDQRSLLRICQLSCLQVVCYKCKCKACQMLWLVGGCAVHSSQVCHIALSLVLPTASNQLLSQALITLLPNKNLLESLI